MQDSARGVISRSDEPFAASPGVSVDDHFPAQAPVSETGLPSAEKIQRYVQNELELK